MENSELKSLLEALLFTATEPLTLDHFSSVISEVDQSSLMQSLDDLKNEYDARNAGMVLREVAGGYQLCSNPKWHAQIQTMFSRPLIIRLSKSSLETLAIVAYKQPITLPEIGEIRSCNASGAIKTLLECNFIKVLGRKRVVGRPFLYGTTREFLVHFGLKELSEMPQLSEFEELIGEKIAPEIFQSTGTNEMDHGEPVQEAQQEAEQESDIFEPPFEE